MASSAARWMTMTRGHGRLSLGSCHFLPTQTRAIASARSYTKIADGAIPGNFFGYFQGVTTVASTHLPTDVSSARSPSASDAPSNTPFVGLSADPGAAPLSTPFDATSSTSSAARYVAAVVT